MAYQCAGLGHCLESVDSATQYVSAQVWDTVWRVWIGGRCLESVASGTLLGECG